MCLLNRRKAKKAKKDRLLECLKGKTAAAKQKSAQKKSSQRVFTSDDFTSDELPEFCNFFCSYEGKQKITTFRRDQTALKRRQESVFDVDNSNCPLVKRPCPPSEISTHVSGESTRAPEPVQTDDISILLRTVRKSLDCQAGTEENVESHTKDVMGQTCKSNHKKKLRCRTKWSKKKHNKEKLCKESASIHDSYKKRVQPYSYDAAPTLRSGQQDQMNTNDQQEQSMSR